MSDLLIVATRHRGEFYGLVWAEDKTAEAYRQLGRWAADENLSFSWYAAAVMSKRIRQLTESSHGID